MECRTKAAVKIIARLNKAEAFELLNLVDSVEKKFKESGIRFQSLDRETAVACACEIMDDWIKDGSLEVPEHLAGSLDSFLKLMVSERAQEDELLFEYNCALCPLLHFDYSLSYFLPETQGRIEEEISELYAKIGKILDDDREKAKEVESSAAVGQGRPRSM